MKQTLLIVIMLISSGCGIGTNSVRVEMPVEMQSYYYEFLQVVGSNHQSSGKILFDSTEIGVLARCKESFLQPWVIVVNPEYWQMQSDDSKRSLIFHELTHCTFHSTKHSSDSTSYMYTVGNTSLDQDSLNAQVSSWVSHL